MWSLWRQPYDINEWKCYKKAHVLLSLLPQKTSGPKTEPRVLLWLNENHSEERNNSEMSLKSSLLVSIAYKFSCIKLKHMASAFHRGAVLVCQGVSLSNQMQHAFSNDTYKCCEREDCIHTMTFNYHILSELCQIGDIYWLY